MLTDLCMCCERLQLRDELGTFIVAQTRSHCLTLPPHCLPDLLQPEHRLWSTQHGYVQPLARP